MSYIHKTAIIHKNAQLESDVSVGPFTIIGEQAKIGEGTAIGANVLIKGDTTIGKDCKIFHGAVIGTVPQDLKYRGEDTKLIIGDNTVIREYATLNIATGEGEETVVGDNCLLMAYIHVAHNCIIGNNVILANTVNLAGHVIIEDHAILGGISGVHQFVHIGQHAFIGGMTKVTQDILPYIRVAGNPLKVNGLNSIGLRRRGFSREALSELKKAYHFLFRSHLNTTQALNKIKAQLHKTDPIDNVVRFLEGSAERVNNPDLHGQGLAK